MIGRDALLQRKYHYGVRRNEFVMRKKKCLIFLLCVLLWCITVFPWASAEWDSQMTANNPALTETAQKKSPETHGEPILIVLSVAVVLLGGSTAAAVVIYAKKNRLF